LILGESNNCSSPPRVHQRASFGRWLIAAVLWTILFVVPAVGVRAPGLPAPVQWSQIDGALILATGFTGLVLLAAVISLARALAATRWADPARP
jgi:hypothetical protein